MMNLSLEKLLLPTIAGMLSLGVSAADFSAESIHTESSRGFGAIQHTRIFLAGNFDPEIHAQGWIENKRQSGSMGSPSLSGHFIEGIFSYPLGATLYGMTRIGLTDEQRLFVDRSFYQEIGYKYGQFGATFLDLNAGAGTRRFPAGTEVFLNLGPTFSWAKGALWVRREQSLNEGGFRHLVSISQWVHPQIRLEATALHESRKKYTLPMAGSISMSEMTANRFALGASYQASPAITFAFKAERVSLQKKQVPGTYYDPASVGLSIQIRF